MMSVSSPEMQQVGEMFGRESCVKLPVFFIEEFAKNGILITYVYN